MPKYEVLKPIEHNGKLYVPRDTGKPDDIVWPETVKSAGHGQNVPVDSGGLIVLSEKEAAEVIPHGTVRPYVPLEEEAPRKKGKKKDAAGKEEED